jgi:hypothetical protein
MKKSITMKNNTTTSLTRKVVTLFTALLFLGLTAGLQTTQAQDEPARLIVEPDDFPLSIGALNIAIEENGGDVIYVLRNGKTYFLDAAIRNQEFLHIEAEEYPSDNPPIIRPGTDLLGNSNLLGVYEASFLMRGIFFLAIDDLGGLQQQQRTNSEGLHMHYQHCYFMAGQNYFWRLEGTNTTVRVEDTQFANSGRNTSWANQRLFDARGNDQDSIIMINSSIYNINNILLRGRPSLINYLYFDHNTVVNAIMPLMTMHIAREVTFTNNLFSSAGLWGTWESAEVVGDAGPGYDGERYLSTDGYLSIASYADVYGEEPDAPTDEERTIIIKNNNFGGLPAQEYLDNWEEFNTYDPENNPILGGGQSPWTTDPEWVAQNPDITPDDPAWALRDTIQRVRIMESHMDSTLRAWEAQEVAWATIENNIRENVTIADMPSGMADYINVLWYGGDGDVPEHYDYWTEISAEPFTRYYHPGPGTPTTTTGPTAEWFRNLAYNEDSESYTLAEMGYPAGNLNFYPDLKELWLQGVDLSTVSVEEEKTNATILAYPNPVKDALHLNQEADEIIIYNILGEQMMKAQNVQSINVSELSNGIYILSIVKNNQISSQKIMVNK